MVLFSLVISTVIYTKYANQFLRILFLVLLELQPRVVELSERNKMSRTFENANYNSNQRKIRFSANVKQILKSRIILKRLFTRICFTSFILPTGYHNEDFEHSLIHDLFKSGYSKDALPVRNKSEAIEVKFDLAYSQLIYLVRKL